MADLWNYFKSLFNVAEQSSPNQPLIHEIIERSEEELSAYQEWRDSLPARKLIDWLRQQHIEYLINPEQIDRSISFLNTPSSKGFAMYFDQVKYEREEILFFFDFLKEKVLGMRYISYVSDVRTYNRPNHIESIQRHYLKPSIYLKSVEAGKVRQSFGNIAIELLLKDEKPDRLKFSATTYNDRIYEEPAQFSDLMQDMLKRG